MAIEYIRNQPVFFGEQDEDCFCEVNPYAQLINLGDVTQFQLKLNTCFDSYNIVQNGDFADTSDWTYSFPWLIVSGSAHHVPDPNIAGGLLQNILAIGKLYQATITVAGMTAGTVSVYIGNTAHLDITTDGTYTFTGISDTVTFQIYATGNFDGTVDDVFVYEIDNRFMFAIYDSSDNFVTKISYQDNPDLFVIDKETITVSIDWETLGITDFGCCYICVLDPCVNTNSQNGIKNGDFTNDYGWENDPYPIFTIISGKAEMTIGGGSPYGSYLNNTLSSFGTGLSYSVTYTISEMDNGTMRLSIGGALGIERTTNGTFTETIVCGAGDVFAIIGSKITTDTAFYKVDNISTILLNNDYTCNMRSNDFKIGSFDCTLRINACNDEDGIGFNFESSGFSPSIRLTGALINAQYKIKRNAEFDSKGQGNVLYGNRRKTKKLIIENQPEYIHDFLSTLLIFDRFYIGNTAYFSEDEEYQVVYNDHEVNYGNSRIEISEKTQLVRNLNIGNEEANCVIGENFWIDESGNFIIDGGDGGKTIIN